MKDEKDLGKVKTLVWIIVLGLNHEWVDELIYFLWVKILALSNTKTKFPNHAYDLCVVNITLVLLMVVIWYELVKL